jgi:hypothetical protein
MSYASREVIFPGVMSKEQVLVDGREVERVCCV